MSLNKFYVMSQGGLTLFNATGADSMKIQPVCSCRLPGRICPPANKTLREKNPRFEKHIPGNKKIKFTLNTNQIKACRER
jgi:hypothetical protein